MGMAVPYGRWNVWTGLGWEPADLRFRLGAERVGTSDPLVWDGSEWSQGGAPGGLERRTVVLSAVSSASYTGSKALRMVNTLCYHGRYSSTYGVQNSLFTFEVPADVRDCVAILNVEMSVFMEHMYDATKPGSIGVSVHYGKYQESYPSTFPNLYLSPPVGMWPGFKGRWLGDREWVDVGGYEVPMAGGSVAESFRSKGAQGLALWTPSTAPVDYGYANGDPASPRCPRLRISYVARVP
jgi:hypothetical protein